MSIFYIDYFTGSLEDLITKGLNALRECLPGDAELTSQVMRSLYVVCIYVHFPEEIVKWIFLRNNIQPSNWFPKIAHLQLLPNSDGWY